MLDRYVFQNCRKINMLYITLYQIIITDLISDLARNNKCSSVYAYHWQNNKQILIIAALYMYISYPMHD